MTTTKIPELAPLTTALDGTEEFELARSSVSRRITSINLFKTVGILPSTDGNPVPVSGYRIPLFRVSDGQPYSCTLAQALTLQGDVPAGGTTGQILAKASDANYDTEWISNSAVGTVTSVNVSGGTTGLSFTGGPVTTSGTMTLAGTLAVASGGTGLGSTTAYAVLCGGTTSTGALQSLASVGTSGQALVSNGAGALPSFQSLPSAIGTALTKADDTNVTLTLGGAPTTALLSATSITAGWTGQLAVARGGTGASTLTQYGVLLGNGTSAIAATSAGTSGYALIGNGSANPTFQGFLQTGTGSVTRTWQSKAADQRDIRDFNGVAGAADNTAALQALADAGGGYIPAGTWYTDPVSVTTEAHFTLAPDAVIAQRTTGVTGPAYNVQTGQIITRQALISFDAGSANSTLSGGTFDGRRASIVGFLNEYQSKWDGIDVFADNVCISNVAFINFNTFALSLEGNYCTASDILVSDSGQGFYAGLYEAPETALPGYPFGGVVGQTIRNIKAVNIDNDGALVFQHAIDLFYTHDANVSGLYINAQAGDASGYSTYASGLTVCSCVNANVSHVVHSGFDAPTLGHLAASFLGNIESVFDEIDIRGFATTSSASCIGIEDISNSDCVISNYTIDGEYSASAVLPSFGVITNIGAQYPLYNRSRRIGLNGTITTHSNGRVVRSSYGYYLRGHYLKFSNCVAIGCDVDGVVFTRWTADNGFGTAVVDPVTYLAELSNFTIMNCGYSGLRVLSVGRLSLTNVISQNNGQDSSVAADERCGFRLQPTTTSGNAELTGCLAEDDQGSTISNICTFEPAASVNDRLTVTITQPSTFNYGQWVTIVNGGGPATDLTGRIVDYTYDEFTLEFAAPVTLSSSGNTTALTGTWTSNATDGTQLDGSGGAASSEIFGALWVTNGSVWRQVTKISGNNTLFIDEAFPAPLAAATLSYVVCSITTIKSQQYGYRLIGNSFTSILPRSSRATGNNVADWDRADLAKFPEGSQFGDGTAFVISSGALRPKHEAAATLLLQAGDTDGTTSNTFVTLTAGSTPTCAISGASADALTSLGIRSTGAAFDLKFATAEAITADRTLSWVMGNAARTITLSGNPTIADWFDQAVKTTSSPTFSAGTITNTLGVGQAAATTTRLTVTGGASGGDLIQLVRTSGTTLTYGWSLGGGRLAFKDVTNSIFTLGLGLDSTTPDVVFGLDEAAAATGAGMSANIRASNAGAAGTDVAGGSLSLLTGKGEGAGAAPSIILRTSTPTASGSTTQSLATRLTVNNASAAFTVPVIAMSGTAIPAGGTAGSGLMVSSTSNFGVFFGSGAPSLSAAQGSIYLRSDGSSTSTRMYVNTNGSTTWTNVTTAA